MCTKLASVPIASLKSFSAITSLGQVGHWLSFPYPSEILQHQFHMVAPRKLNMATDKALSPVTREPQNVVLSYSRLDDATRRASARDDLVQSTILTEESSLELGPLSTTVSSSPEFGHYHVTC